MTIAFYFRPLYGIEKGKKGSIIASIIAAKKNGSTAKSCYTTPIMDEVTSDE